MLFRSTEKTIPVKSIVRQMAKLGADSLPIVMMTILFTGMVFSVQTAKEFVRFGASSSVGGIVAIAMGRELVPVLTGVVVAGRIGAAIAAEIGTMKVTEQIDALKVMATNPTTYLVVPRFLAIVLMMPVLIVFANTIGNIGSCLLIISPMLPSSVWSINRTTDLPNVASRRKGLEMRIFPRDGNTLFD